MVNRRGRDKKTKSKSGGRKGGFVYQARDADAVKERGETGRCL